MIARKVSNTQGTAISASRKWELYVLRVIEVPGEPGVFKPFLYRCKPAGRAEGIRVLGILTSLGLGCFES